MTRVSKNGILLFAVGALLSVGLAGSGCAIFGGLRSRGVCGDFCAKKFDCADKNPTGEETKTCVSNCRDSLDDRCGKENQSAANDKIEECVEKGCFEFGACMVFDVAPECLGFASD